MIVRMAVEPAPGESFIREARAGGEVWSISSADGVPAIERSDGETAVPFWSMADRASRFVKTVVRFQGFEAQAIDLDTWLLGWLPQLAEGGHLLGLNWSGDPENEAALEPNEVTDRFGASNTSVTAPSDEDGALPRPRSLLIGFAHEPFFKPWRHPIKGQFLVPTALAHAFDPASGTTALCGQRLKVSEANSAWPDTDARLCETCERLAADLGYDS